VLKRESEIGLTKGPCIECWIWEAAIRPVCLSRLASDVNCKARQLKGGKSDGRSSDA